MFCLRFDMGSFLQISCNLDFLALFFYEMDFISLKLHHLSEEIIILEFQTLPAHRAMLIVLMFAWLKMAKICENPYDEDAHYDINLDEVLDLEIWRSSVTLQSTYLKD